MQAFSSRAGRSSCFLLLSRISIWATQSTIDNQPGRLREHVLEEITCTLNAPEERRVGRKGADEGGHESSVEASETLRTQNHRGSLAHVELGTGEELLLSLDGICRKRYKPECDTTKSSGSEYLGIRGSHDLVALECLAGKLVDTKKGNVSGHFAGNGGVHTVEEATNTLTTHNRSSAVHGRRTFSGLHADLDELDGAEDGTGNDSSDGACEGTLGEGSCRVGELSVAEDSVEDGISGLEDLRVAHEEHSVLEGVGKDRRARACVEAVPHATGAHKRHKAAEGRRGSSRVADLSRGLGLHENLGGVKGVAYSNAAETTDSTGAKVYKDGLELSEGSTKPAAGRGGVVHRRRGIAHDDVRGAARSSRRGWAREHSHTYRSMERSGILSGRTRSCRRSEEEECRSC
mmetsp:Transcript_26525/g.42466  ORF Transcript_26525/g.42466 Transcript_26525/m.42466 type:complete len:404 (+) Transcript_26525:1695-2906(+)